MLTAEVFNHTGFFEAWYQVIDEHGTRAVAGAVVDVPTTSAARYLCDRSGLIMKGKD
jgi:hypothetical protein